MKRLYLVILIIVLLSACNTVAGPGDPSNVQYSSSSASLSRSTSFEISIPSWIPDTLPEKPEDQLTTYVPQANTGWTPVDVIEVSGKYADTFPVVTNETPLEGMLSQMDDPLFYMAWMRNLQWYYPYENDRYGDRAQPTLERIMKGETWGNFSFHVPVNFLRKTGPGQYYTVCKQKEGGYVYIFFDRPRVETDAAKYATSDETNVFLTGVLYAEKRLTYADFTGIARGDSIDKVILVDNAAALSKTFHEWNASLYGQDYFHSGYAASSLHLLTDGILEVTYKITDDTLIVEDMMHYEDFNYMLSQCYRDYGEKYYMNLKVLPQDYPPES